MAVPKGEATLEDVTRDALAKLRHLQAAIGRKIAKGEVTAAVQREAGSLSRAIIALGSEMRQQQKAMERDAGSLTEEEEDDLVLEFILELPPRRRKRYRDALMHEKAGQTLLG